VRPTFDPFRLLLISIAGWLGQHQRDVIDYLQEENLVLRQQLGNKRLRLSNDQRRRLAAKAKKLGRRILREVATIVMPETLLGWYRLPSAWPVYRTFDTFNRGLSTAFILC
jgi:hypothetical protein